jgi:hypothetical protein
MKGESIGERTHGMFNKISESTGIKGNSSTDFGQSQCPRLFVSIQIVGSEKPYGQVIVPALDTTESRSS